MVSKCSYLFLQTYRNLAWSQAADSVNAITQFSPDFSQITVVMHEVIDTLVKVSTPGQRESLALIAINPQRRHARDIVSITRKANKNYAWQSKGA